MRAAAALLLAACLPALSSVGRGLAAEPPDEQNPPAAPLPRQPNAAGPAPLGAPALDGELSLVSLARHVRASVVAVEVRSPSRPPVTRHAVVVDAAGWLVLAGPTLGPKDTIVVRPRPDVALPAVPVGSDAGTAITLLQILGPPGDLTPLVFPSVEARKPLPPTPEPGTVVVMVTSDGAVARGRLRASERQRMMVDAAHGTTGRTTGLLEAAIASVARDLGSPWVDGQGRCLGLLVGGVVDDASEEEGVPADIELRPEPVAAHAVPAAVVALVWPLLRAHQSLPRSRLGLRARPAGEALRLHVCGGCGGQEITGVDAGGPAERAGIEPEDLLVALDGHPLRAGASLADALLPYRPMDTVLLTLVRHGERIERGVVLAAR